MQHWGLCEVLRRLGQQEWKDLLLVCTHSMAPWSVPERRADEATNRCRRTFTVARQRLAASRTTVFEGAWHSLSASGGLPYPSSAVFASHVWERGLSLILCETQPSVAEEIDGWLGTPELQARLQNVRLHRGDWRDALDRPLATENCEVVLIEMDPMRFEHHPPGQCCRADRAVLFPEDIERLRAAIEGLTIPVVIQISSFSSNNGNPHHGVEAEIGNRLAPAGFIFQGRIKVGGQMLSLLFCRGTPLFGQGQNTEAAFDSWLSGI
jgi:hypothetical protein